MKKKGFSMEDILDFVRWLTIIPTFGTVAFIGTLLTFFIFLISSIFRPRKAFNQIVELLGQYKDLEVPPWE